MARFDAKYDAEVDAFRALMTEYKNVLVTTTDLKEDYKIVGPVMQYISNMGVYAADYEMIKERYSQSPFDRLIISLDEFAESNEKERRIAKRLFAGAIKDDDEIQTFQDELDTAAAICLGQLKLRAAGIGANAVIGVRIETEIDPSAKNMFFIKIYGTAVQCENIDKVRVVLKMDENKSLI